LHKLTSYLAKKYRVVVIEDLQVKNSSRITAWPDL
jgi:transposase